MESTRPVMRCTSFSVSGPNVDCSNENTATSAAAMMTTSESTDEKNHSTRRALSGRAGGVKRARRRVQPRGSAGGAQPGGGWIPRL